MARNDNDTELQPTESAPSAPVFTGEVLVRDRELERLRSEVARYVTRVAVLQDRDDVWTERAARLELSVVRAEEELARSRGDARVIHAERDALRVTLEEHREQLASLQETVDGAAAALLDVRAEGDDRVRETLAVSEALQRAHADAIAERESLLAALRAEVDQTLLAVRRQAEALQEQSLTGAQTRLELDAARRGERARAAEVSRVATDRDDARADAGRLRERVGELEPKLVELASMAAERERVRTERDRARTERDRARAEGVRLDERIADLDASLEERAAELARVQAQLEETAERLSQRAAQLKVVYDSRGYRMIRLSWRVRRRLRHPFGGKTVEPASALDAPSDAATAPEPPLRLLVDQPDEPVRAAK